MESTRAHLRAGAGGCHFFVPATAEAKPDDVEVQLLGINDFHGNLEPPTGSSGLILPAPGQPSVSAPAARNTWRPTSASFGDEPELLFVSAGDLIGASPFLSAMFHDEPTIEALIEMGLALTSVGNHEFDEGEGGIAADAERRPPPDRHGLARARTRTVASTARTSGSLRRQRRPRDTAGLMFAPRDPQVRQHQGRLHRHDARGVAGHRLPVRASGTRISTRPGDGQPLRTRVA